jgi:UDP-N-acetylmuramoyl-L-alanyl-D-glutamate--2,6-diaminopimelate ligase
MTIAETLEGVRLAVALPQGLARAEVSGLEYDSRRVDSGSLFFAFLGQQFDGRQFAPEAIERGALAVICETPKPEFFDGPWIQVEHGRKALATAARNTYRQALEAVSITGITGTNGKTTTAYLTDAILRAAGRTTAMVGTIEYHLAGKPQKSINTTPESLDLYRIIRKLAELGGTNITMEVSSHALAQGRVHGMPYHTAVFTNLTRDHLDFHGTLEEYFDAKRQLFEGVPPPGYAVLNLDDGWSEKIRPADGARVLWYGLGERADVRATNIQTDFNGVRFTVHWQGRCLPISSPMLGRINVYNILAAVGVGISYNLPLEDIAEGVARCRAVPGRFERIEEGQPFLVVVDYAHTDDALRNVIAAARELQPNRIITVFGCGGDRDRTKRPLMGQAAGEGSDFVVLTSDNPRSEDPLAIMNDAMVGLRRQDVAHKVEPDRESAIQLALTEANAGDVVLIAGKGHETYQILKDRTVPFDDREVARRLLRGFGFGEGAA